MEHYQRNLPISGNTFNLQISGWILFGLFLLNTLPLNGQWQAAVLAENAWHYRPGISSPSVGWQTNGFNDSSWDEGPGGIGYGDGDDNTQIPQTLSVCMRRTFGIIDSSVVQNMVLYADYDDGFVAYLNGVEIARVNIGTPGIVPAFNEPASDSHEAQMYEGGLPEAFTIPLNEVQGLLKNGSNTLAIQVHNVSLNSSDLSGIFFLLLNVTDGSYNYQPAPSWFTPPLTFGSSNLPLLFVETTSGQDIPDEPKIEAHLGIVDNGSGSLNYLTDPFNGYDGKIGIEIRGSSSLSFPKHNFSLETRLENGDNNNVSLLGMPEENDWVLHGPYSDKSLMRNVLSYYISRETGRYAPRTRWCELYVNQEYQGVYVLTEKIKRDQNRVDIATLNPEDIAGDELTGGYIFSLDRDDEGPGTGWSSPFTNAVFFKFQDPNPEQLMPQQKDYLQDYINEFESAMSSPGYADFYENYIDVDSWIDYWITTEMYKHIDNFKFSFYMYKRKDSNGGKIHFGPQWDINLGYGNFDFAKDDSPYGWSYIWANLGFLRPFWVLTLTSIPEIQNQTNCRWLELREGPLQTDSLLQFIDDNALLLEAAQARNFQRWPVLGEYVWPNSFVGPDYESEINYLKNWLTERLEWMDDNMLGDCSALSTEAPSTSKSILQVFPNPFHGEVHFLLQSPQHQKGVLHVYDFLGRTVAELEMNNLESKTLFLGDVPAGIYFYRLTEAQKVISFGRLVKE